jgi:hypothetical protein
MRDYLPCPGGFDANDISAGNDTLMRQAQGTAHTYMLAAVEDIDEVLGKGYARQHPELIVGYTQTAAAAALELLDAALQAWGRMRRCRAQIDKDGEAVKDRWGQTRAHPLLIAERGARDSFLKAMRLLNLDTSETDR